MESKTTRELIESIEEMLSSIGEKVFFIWLIVTITFLTGLLTVCFLVFMDIAYSHEPSECTCGPPEFLPMTSIQVQFTDNVSTDSARVFAVKDNGELEDITERVEFVVPERPEPDDVRPWWVMQIE